MSVFALKLCAVLFMLVDHLGILLYRHQQIAFEFYHWMRLLGRFSFPLYAFLLAEGFRHIRKDPERVGKHAELLLLLAVVSELFFDRFLYGAWISSKGQSVIVTMLLGFCGLLLAERHRSQPWIQAGIFLLIAVCARQLSTDYSAPGVLLIIVCYIYLERTEHSTFGKRLFGMLLVMTFYYAVYCWVHSGGGAPAEIWNYARRMGDYIYPHIILIPILASYTGKPGPRLKPLHRCYQWFYPIHLALLVLAGKLLG